MATVNEQAYGSKDLWYSIPYGSTQFPPSTTIDEHNTLANFTDTIPSSIDWHLWLGRVIYEVEVNNNQALRDLFYNTVFDKSICFVGQSGKSSYTSIRFFDNQGTDAQNHDVRELPTQTYDVVNLAFNYGLGSMRDYGNGVRRWDVIGADIDKDPSGNDLKFDAIRWCPLGWSGIKGTNYYYTDYGNRYKTTFVTNMGTKRNVLIPYIKAGPTDTSDTNAIGTYDLSTYLSTYKDTKPYVYSIGFETCVMYGDSIDASSSNRRTFDDGYGLMLMEYISSLNDFYYIGPNNAWQTAHYNNDLFVSQTLKSPHMPLGGYINNGSYADDTPSTLGYESTLNNVGVHAVIDCNDIKWDTWINVGSSTAEGTCNKILVADARKYTADDFREAVRSSLACFGMFFTDDSEVASSGKLDDPQMHLGTIVNGVGYGDYTSGSDNKNQPQWTWTSMSDNEYDPSNPPIPDRNSDPVTFNPVSLVDGGLKRYVLDDNAMSAFGVDLYRIIDTSNPDELIQNQTLTNFLTNNPLDAVVSVKRFPLPDMSQGVTTNIMLGKVQMQTAAKPFASTSTILSCGSINIPAKFGNFLDYQTQYELILPFCGTISLDPKIVTGKSVEVKYSIDYTTGTCTAWILTVTSDGVETVIDSANGNCTIDIPLSGVQTATLTGQIYNANETLKTAKFNAVVNAVSGIGDFAKDVKSRDVAGGAKTVANVVNSIHDIKKTEWTINNTQIPFKMVGASSGCNSFAIEMIPRLNVYYPIVDSTYNAAEYRHNVGAAVCDTTTIGDYSGYAEITNVDLSGFVATAEEKNMIANALMGGVYL